MRKLLLIVPIILLAVACNQQPAPVHPAQNPPAQTSQQLQTKPADDVVNWKTYFNTKYGFEFKYSDSWGFADETGLGAASYAVRVYDTQAKNSNDEDRFHQFRFSTANLNDYLALSQSAKTLEESIIESQTNGTGYVKFYKKITFNGYPAFLVQVKERSNSELFWNILISYKNNVYIIELPRNATDSYFFGLSGAESQILSTFKFTK